MISSFFIMNLAKSRNDNSPKAATKYKRKTLADGLEAQGLG